MAIILDESARAAVDRRRAKGRDCVLYLRIERRSARFGVPPTVEVSWAPRHLPARDLVAGRVEDVRVCMDPYVARFVRDEDVVVTTWRLGPVESLTVSDPFLIFRLAETNPSLLRPPSFGSADSPTQPVAAGRPHADDDTA